MSKGSLALDLRGAELIAAFLVTAVVRRARSLEMVSASSVSDMSDGETLTRATRGACEAAGFLRSDIV